MATRLCLKAYELDWRIWENQRDTKRWGVPVRDKESEGMAEMKIDAEG